MKAITRTKECDAVFSNMHVIATVRDTGLVDTQIRFCDASAKRTFDQATKDPSNRGVRWLQYNNFTQRGGFVT